MEPAELALRQRLAELVASCTDGAVSAADALRAEAPLRLLGVDSLGFLRLFDAIEADFGVELDPTLDPTTLDSVDTIAEQLHQQGVGCSGPGQVETLSNLGHS